MKADYSRVSEVIKSKYGSFSNPNFSFVAEAAEDDSHKLLKEKLSRDYAVRYITDLNDDVSSRYLVENEGKRWIVELSFLGNYAAFFRLSGQERTEIISQARDKHEANILELLVEDGFEIMSKDLLECHLPLRLSNTDSSNVRVYQALFSDTDLLPWIDAESG